MKKPLVAYIVLGVLAYLFFLVWTFPAERAVALLRSQVPQLQMAGVSGTAWSGRATTLQYQTQRLSRCSWQLKPLSLALGRVEFAIAFDGEGRKGEADIAWRYDGSLLLSDADASMPMAELAPLLGVPVTLNGLVDLKLDELVASGRQIESAQGEFHWRQAAVAAPVVQALGEFSAQITTEAAGIKAQIRDNGGPLQLEGFLRLIKDGSYQFNAKVNVRDPQQTMLKQALQMAGRQEPDGRVVLEYNGRL